MPTADTPAALRETLTVALVAIRCPRHGAMQQRASYTAEQRFCGAWWQCSDPRCGYTVLYPSIALRAQLAQQEAA